MPQQGYLVIADISGYTAFMTQAELEHAEDILRTLFDTLLKELRPPFVISKLEGDAIFCYAPEGSFLQGQTLLEAIENLYCIFVRTKEQMCHNTTCTCTACKLIPTLDLKFVLHYGTFILSKIGGREELSGPDVILIHRLLKSSISETTGVAAYAFFTEAAVRAMALGDLAEGMQAHREQYEHLGEVSGLVHNLHTIWVQRQATYQVRLDKEKLWFQIHTDLPIPPALAWDYLTEPERKEQWMAVDSFKTVGRNKGRLGVGTQQHCAHGNQEVVITVVDWHPFEYLTMDSAMPMNAILRDMVELQPTESGTRVSWYLEKPTSPNPLSALVWQLMGRFMKDSFKANMEKGLAHMRAMVESDLAAGKIVISTEPESSLA